MTTDELTIEGRSTTAVIKTTNVDEYCTDQVAEMVNHEAFDNPVRIMPDAHGGAGAVVGFTMPLGEKIVPNTVGVDIGCGMTAFNLGYSESLRSQIENSPESVDVQIRERIPLGFETYGDIEHNPNFHMHDDFPWGTCEEKAERFNTAVERAGLDIPDVDTDYGPVYFDELCDRVGHDPMRAINSFGTLGGGNHFIEISQSGRGDEYWVVVHSGSRGIGNDTAQWWQERAHENCDERAGKIRSALKSVPEWSYKFDPESVSDGELLRWVTGGVGEDWKDTAEIRNRKDGSGIGELVGELQEIGHIASDHDGGNPLDYLDGDNRAGYLKDMIFAQTYAIQSRHQMCHTVADILGTTPIETIDSIHNYIDFEDLVIRKGATRAHAGELGIIPFNMRDGAVIIEGNGNAEWNQSAPHGAGRRGSRRWAYETFDVDEYESELSDVFSTSVNEETLDEAPMAYKDTDDILSRIKPTAHVVDELTPKINIKAE